jgi:hypothetical protein
MSRQGNHSVLFLLLSSYPIEYNDGNEQIIIFSAWFEGSLHMVVARR